MPRPKFHAQFLFERACPHCRKIVRVLVHDYGELTPENLDEKTGMHNFPVLPVKCPLCAGEDWPTHAVLFDATEDRVVRRVPLGTADLPVVGGGAPYAVTYSPEEQAELERGLAKLPEFFRQKGEEFWERYCAWALSRWRDALKEISPEEWAEGYASLGVSLPGHPSPAACRKDAEARFASDKEKTAAWRALNRWLVEKEFLWIPVDQWPVEEWAARYGRERVTWLLLNLPLLEELERWRTEKLAPAVPKKTCGPQAVLWERIKQLGQALDRQRRRSEELSRLLQEERAARHNLEEKLAAARAEVSRLREELSGRPVEAGRNPEDARRIARLKSLVRELREEVLHLREMLPREEPAPDKEEPTPVTAPAEEVPRLEDVLVGRIVVAFGRVGEPLNGPVRILWHHGDRWDLDAERLAKEADVLVVLTRFCSHEAMWAAKEFAADTGKPIGFARGSGVESVLRAAADVWARQKKEQEFL